MPDTHDGQPSGRREKNEDSRQDTNDLPATTDSGQAGGGKKNVSAEPAPELSEHGGIEPRERDPSKYNDRTRDRDLGQS